MNDANGPYHGTRSHLRSAKSPLVDDVWRTGPPTQTHQLVERLQISPIFRASEKTCPATTVGTTPSLDPAGGLKLPKKCHHGLPTPGENLETSAGPRSGGLQYELRKKPLTRTDGMSCTWKEKLPEFSESQQISQISLSLPLVSIRSCTETALMRFPNPHVAHHRGTVR